MANRNSGVTNSRAEVDAALSRLVTSTRGFVHETVRARCPDILERIPDERLGQVKTINDIATTRDTTALLAILGTAWDQAFADRVKAPGVGFPLVDKVRAIRNEFSHDGERGFTPADIKAINDLRAALVASAPQRPPPPRPPPDNTVQRPRPRPTSPQPAQPAQPTGQRRRKMVRLAYFSGLMTLACVLGILAGVIAVYVGFSNDLAFGLWLCICALSLDIFIAKLNWRSKPALVLKYSGKIGFWLTLGAVVSGAISELPMQPPANLVPIPMFVIWALGAFLILRRMMTAARNAAR